MEYLSLFIILLDTSDIYGAGIITVRKYNKKECLHLKLRLLMNLILE